MNALNLTGDLISIVASLVAFSYVLGIWRMVHAPPRAVLLLAVGYMVVTRIVIIVAADVSPANWLALHRSLIIVPQYVLFAVAFAMTYYEIRHFSFGLPKAPEERDTQRKHEADMAARSKPMEGRKDD